MVQFLNKCWLVFDESGTFLMYGTLLGIKREFQGFYKQN